jgi:hypothetical protein
MLASAIGYVVSVLIVRVLMGTSATAAANFIQMDDEESQPSR